MKLKAGDRVWIGERMGACTPGYAKVLTDDGLIRHPGWPCARGPVNLGITVEINHAVFYEHTEDYVFLIEALIGEGTIVVHPTGKEAR